MTGEKSNEQTINNKKQIITFSAGEFVLREGEINDEMFKILSGNVELYIGYGTENEVLLGILGKGDCFGEFGLLLHKPAIYTAIAYSDLILFKVTEGKIGDFIMENHASVLQIMRSMADTMLIMQHQLTQLNEELDEKNKTNMRIVGKNKELLRRYVQGKYGNI